MSEEYILTLNREQAALLSRACEFYSRVRNGQFHEIVWELSLNEHKYAAANFDWDLVDALLSAARKPIFPNLSMSPGHHYGVNHDHDSDVAWDTHEVIRHAIAYHDNPEGGEGVYFREPMNWSGLPLPKIQVKEES